MKPDKQPRCDSPDGVVPLRMRFCCFFWLLLALFTPAVAQEESRPVVYVAGTSANEALTRHMINLLSDALGTGVILEPFKAGRASGNENSVTVALGPEAFAQVRQASRTRPILALLVDLPFIERYAARSDGQIGAVLYNPPLIRQAVAGKVILPHATRVAMLATPESVELYEDLVPQLPDFGMEGRVFVVSHNDNLIPTLIRALEYGDFLLAAPDSNIYNPRTIKHILLTTYRRNRIVIGPSQAYVKAGALASTYVPLEHIADAAAEQVIDYQQTGRFPAPDYPDIFRLEINRQVARSLNIPLPSREELRAAIELRLSSERESANE